MSSLCNEIAFFISILHINFRYALSQIEDDDSGSEFHLNRILYVQDYITRVERLVRALKMVEVGV